MRGLVRVLVRAVVLLGAACGGDDDGGAGADASGDLPRWDALDDVPSGAVQETSVVEMGGLLYVIGGIQGGGGTIADVLIYDPDGDSWSEGPNLPFAVHHANTAVLDGTIYVAGALTPSFAPLPVVWSWAPGDDAWREDLAQIPTGFERGASAVGVVDGRILVAGGTASASLGDVIAYDPGGDAWDTSGVADLPEAIDHGTGQVVDGVFYVIGGRTGGVGNVTGAVHAYDPAADEWEPRAAMPTARGGIGAGVVDGSIVVVGGEGNTDASSGVFPQAERYDPAVDAWESLPNMRTPRHGMGAAGHDGALYVPGGADVQGLGAVATHEVLRLR